MPKVSGTQSLKEKNQKKVSEKLKPLGQQLKATATKSPLQEKLKVKQLLQQDNDDGKRKITKKIAQNRGLTKHTRKEYRNPRVKLRVRYAKAEKKHNARVKKVAGPRPTVEAYDGEATGINDRVVRSVSLSHR